MDIYFDENYGKLYEEIECGTAEVFRFSSELGEVKHQFIQREIPILLADGKTRFDLITPYGYGGPLVINAVEGKQEELCEQFGKAFQEYCKAHDVVSEFVRFHPVIDNAKNFAKIYDTIYIRETLGTNLKDYDDPVQSEFSRSCRKNIRQALHAGITYRVTEAPDDISAFKGIYYSTMQRDHASDFYYFKDGYFEEILRNFKKNVLYVEALYEERTIAAGLYFIADGMIHIHLSGTLSEYLYLSPAYILRYAVALWGKEHGYAMIHHGGGTSDSPDNSLYLFKKQFAKNTRFSFCVGKKIWDREAYQMLCLQANKAPDSDFFPAYRA